MDEAVPARVLYWVHIGREPAAQIGSKPNQSIKEAGISAFGAPAECNQYAGHHALVFRRTSFLRRLGRSGTGGLAESGAH